MRTETILFDGKLYRRYPDNPIWKNRVYFSRADTFLHREIYRKHKGEIPAGFPVHHKDGNPLNNEPKNLEALSPRQHGKCHRNKPRDIIRECIECHCLFESVSKVRAKFCSNACKSAWRRNHGKDDIEKECAVCSAKFVSNKYKKKKCCSRSCAIRYQWQTPRREARLRLYRPGPTGVFRKRNPRA